MTQYVKFNAKTGQVTNILNTPTESYHLVTKEYVDSLMANPFIIGMTIDSSEVDENASVDTIVGYLTAIGGTAPVVFEIVTDSDDKFKIGGSFLDELQVKNEFDYINKTSHDVTIRATDVNLRTFDKTFTINLTVGPYTSTKCLQLNNAVTDEYVISTGLTGGPLDFTSQFTIAYWINCGNNTSFSHFNLGTDATTSKAMVLNNGTTGDQQRFYIKDSSGQLENLRPTGYPDWSDNTWHHLCFSYSEDNPKCYVDGVLYPNSFFANPNMVGTLESADILLIGSRFPGPTAVTKAKFDQFIMFDVQLSNDEVSELYNSGNQNYNALGHSRYTDIVAWYKMDAINANIIQDEIGNANLTGVNIDSSNIVNV